MRRLSCFFKGGGAEEMGGSGLLSDCTLYTKNALGSDYLRGYSVWQDGNDNLIYQTSTFWLRSKVFIKYDSNYALLHLNYLMYVYKDKSFLQITNLKSIVFLE